MPEEKTETDEQTIPETNTVSTRITKQMYMSINKILETGAYLNITDYLRSVIRNDLKRRGLLSDPSKTQSDIKN